MDELEDVLLRAKFRAYASPEQVSAYVEALAAEAVAFDDPRDPPRVTPDPDDDYLVALARAARADLLVSGDKHLSGPRRSARPVVTPHHPAPLPRYRGPIPLSWALREGDTEFFLTWHRMDAELDTGPILAQSSIPILDEETTIFETGPRLIQAKLELLPRVFERLAAGDPGEPQATEGASWAGYFEEDYATVDWSQTAREIHNQVRAWNFAFGMGPVDGPFAELDGKRVKLKRTSLTDPGDGSQAVDVADGKIWILESEPVEERS